jgi:hypothetical protein
MRRFYALVRTAHGQPQDPTESARLEVEWWRVHRAAQQGAPGARDELVDALARLYAFVFGVAESRRRTGSGSYRYELTGLAGHAADVRSERGHAGSEFVITTGDQAFLARTAGPASEVAAGSRVTAQCTLSVVADYEWDAFDLPDLRTDWHVRRLKLEHRQVDYAPAGPGIGGRAVHQPTRRS